MTTAARQPAVRRLLPVLPEINLDLSSVFSLSGSTRAVDLQNAVSNMQLELSMSRASVLNITCEDAAHDLLRDELLGEVLALSLDPSQASHYAQDWTMDRVRGCGGVSTQGTTTTLGFWGAGEAALKAQTKTITKSSTRMNLEGFVTFLAREAAADYSLIPVVPRPGSAPPRETGTTTTATGTTASTSLGFSAANARKVTVKGQPADREQLRNIDVVLTVAARNRVSSLAVWATICANIGESQCRRTATNPTSNAKGVFQLLPSTVVAFGLDPADTEACAQQFLMHGYTRGKNGDVGAVQFARQRPRLSPGTIASKVEGSDQGGRFYDVYANEARTIIELWSGTTLARWGTVTGPAATSTDSAATQERPSEWRRGTAKTPESSWSALFRIAQGLGRRCFVSAGRLVVARDQDLILAAPHMSVALNDPIFSETPAINQQGNQRLSTIDVTVFKGGWSAPPGAVVDMLDAGPATMAWLVDSIRAQAGEDLMQVTLTQPTTKIPSGGGGASVNPNTATRGAQAAIQWATQRIGWKEVGSNDGPQIGQLIRDQGGTPGQPWCGYFVRGALRAAGLNAPVAMGDVQWISDTAAISGSVFQGRTTAAHARPGDIAIFGPDSHCGLVDIVDVTHSEIHTIEGNHSNAVGRAVHPFSGVTSIAKVGYGTVAVQRKQAAAGPQHLPRRQVP